MKSMKVEELEDAEILPVNFEQARDLKEGQIAATIIDVLDLDDGLHHAVKFEVMDKTNVGNDGNPKRFWQKFKTTDLRKMAKVLSANDR
jgi:hypothetical protein